LLLLAKPQMLGSGCHRLCCCRCCLEALAARRGASTRLVQTPGSAATAVAAGRCGASAFRLLEATGHAAVVAMVTMWLGEPGV
jgi:hypothetical protein